jgi:hypothetical protein
MSAERLSASEIFPIAHSDDVGVLLAARIPPNVQRNQIAGPQVFNGHIATSSPHDRARIVPDPSRAALSGSNNDLPVASVHALYGADDFVAVQVAAPS